MFYRGRYLAVAWIEIVMNRSNTLVDDRRYLAVAWIEIASGLASTAKDASLPRGSVD